MEEALPWCKLCRQWFCSEHSPLEERARRYSVSFFFEGTNGLAVQPYAFVLEPLRLLVTGPSEDALVHLRVGARSTLYRNWVLGLDGMGRPQVAHVRHLECSPPEAPLTWKPAERATVDVLEGRVLGAALISARAGVVPQEFLP